MEPLSVIADDLTGACDVGAALLPWPEPVLVDVGGGVACVAPTPGLCVHNTQSRTLPPPRAAAGVRDALGHVPRDWTGIVLKKIDTGLRGSLGAELDAAMDAVGATEAFVLPAIPEVGRTTSGGVQRIDGVPVDATAFAADPENPVNDARVAAVIEATSRRRAGVVDLTEIRRGTVASRVDRLRAAGVAAIVCDAETEQDLDRTVRILLARARPLVLAGSTGLARALRRALGTLPANASRHDRDRTTAARGVLCVVGSLHPVARDQLAAAEALLGVRVLVVATDAEARRRGEEAASCIAAGVHVALVTPAARACPEGLRLLGEAVRHSLGGGVPAGLVLVGGETAFRVLVSIGVRWLVVEGTPAPLAVLAHVASGPLAGMPVMTKGGSSGSPEGLAELLREVVA